MTEESTDYPGFYYSDRFPEIAVSKDGEIVKIAKYTIGRKTRGTPFSNGYMGFRTYDAVAGKSRTVLVHHIVLFTFKPEKWFMGAEVNHIDGDVTNNALHNLEWVTSRDNIRHAITTLKRGSYTLRPVKVKDLRTGRVIAFDSITDANEYYGITGGHGFKGALASNLKCLRGRYLIKDINDDTPWPDVKIGELSKEKAIYSVNRTTGAITIFAGVTEAARLTDIPRTTLRRALERGSNRTINGCTYHYMYEGIPCG